ncbi:MULTISPECIES: hypothetical protein [unclassified Arcicella]|uniref:hypothetical protein n=1 Tax=unclassified Arcicella TaxID=2644986 RepID=UPI0028576523|nr:MULTISPECIES: hypothetical protein [unclassified Arcicella]MDR6562718.1 hypothetical protein [Arcicella sp. BE51]MDR6812937.1 hypothetical protein [Arcicella sp. BE140]MDR6824251.1 hypothetical protein [Arcicella sp. BE139]
MYRHNGKVYKYSGVPVTEILGKAGVTLGKQLKGENLSKYHIVKAADGYEVLFSLAELDASFTDKVKPARCIFEVTNLIVRSAKD